jgi:cell division protein FtsQ
VNRDHFNLPTARTWRDIPQPVVPRAMSREGRWRFTMSAFRVVLVIAMLGAIGWGAWLVSLSLRRNVDVAKAAVMKAPELRTDGVLDEAWLTRTLALPPKSSLIELDLQKLRTRLLADDQVVSAELTRNFPDRLIVKISERSPVARIMTQWRGQMQPLLVARDGVLYVGNNYHPDLLATLPWLDGVSITAEGGKPRPIAGMMEVAELLAKARLGAGRALEALHRDAQDLSRPWPRVAPEVLAEGLAAVERAAAALRKLDGRLDAGHSLPDSPS